MGQWLAHAFVVCHVCTRRAAGGAGGDGGVNVKLLAEQNVQLKEALKRLHTHSIAEKTDVSTRHISARLTLLLLFILETNIARPLRGERVPTRTLSRHSSRKFSLLPERRRV